MHQVKSKYKNPDKFIEGLKQQRDYWKRRTRQEEAGYIGSTKRVRFDVEQDKYELGNLKPSEAVKLICTVRTVVMDQDAGTTVVSLSPMCVRRRPQD